MTKKHCSLDAKQILTAAKLCFCRRTQKSLVTVSNQTDAKILNSKFGNQTVDVEVEAAAPSLVVVAQTYYHDWRAEIDGQPVPLLRANVAFQAVQVPAGTHKMHLFYHDRAFEIGAAVSIAAWFGCLFVCFRRAGPKKLIKISQTSARQKNSGGFKSVAGMAKNKRIGILTAGGDSPGLNAAIRGVGKTALGTTTWRSSASATAFAASSKTAG